MKESSDTRRRILDAAAGLLAEHGREGVTTRAVSAAAGVQPPTIYRQFTDMGGLLDAVAADGFEAYLAQKHALGLTDDPVQDLRTGWDLHVEFGVTHPAHYLLMYGQRRPAEATDAARRADERLRMLVERVAAVGRLTVPAQTAAAMMRAAGSGLTLHLIGTPAQQRDPDVSVRLREAVLSAVTGDSLAPAAGHVQHATALRARLDATDGVLTPGERALLGELLDRLSAQPAEPADG